MYITASTYGGIDWHDSRTIHEQLKSNGSYNIEKDKVPEAIAEDIAKGFPYVEDIREKVLQALSEKSCFRFMIKSEEKDSAGNASYQDDKEVCRKVLEKILGVSIREVSVPATQKTINTLYDGKGIWLDVYLNDSEGTVYNVEMERGKHKKAILPERSRYYQGNIDLDIISAGEDYRKLKKSFVIFICTFDPFGDQRHLYTFENRCAENPSLTLGDETTKIFLNTKGSMHFP